jgi:23S rRNA G2445 N2-methylase RlmL
LGQWSVDQIVCNPPFGEQTGNLQGIQSLYQQFLQECRRVLKPTGRMALATTRSSLLNSLLDAQKLFKVAQRFPIDLRGQEVSVFLCLPR